MIANVVNTPIGIAVAYWAVFNAEPDTIWQPAVGAVVMFVLAFVARRSDVSTWQSTTNMVLAVGLLIIVGLSWAEIIWETGTFWMVFWAGLLVAIFALWAALYRRPAPDEASSA